jgi:hypothetical protein
MNTNTLLNEFNENGIVNMTSQDKCKLLKIYYILLNKEDEIFDLIYSYHGCDSYEDIFRDYDITISEEKAEGVMVALENMNDDINLKTKSNNNSNNGNVNLFIDD